MSLTVYFPETLAKAPQQCVRLLSASPRNARQSSLASACIGYAIPQSFHWAPSRPATATSTSRWAHSPLARPLALREVSIMRHDNLSETSLVRDETPKFPCYVKALG